MLKTMTLATLTAALALGCSQQVDSEEQARLAYLGIDRGIERAMQLGFDGFNTATSANIPAQSADGAVSGEMSITGQVDQGSSANKGMRLEMRLTDYADEPVKPLDENGEEIDEEYEIHYDTDSAVAVEFSLRNIPNGTLTGTIGGTVLMTQDLEGELTLALSLDGDIEDDPDDPSLTRRQPGSTRITGTASSEFGDYEVDITR